LGGCGGGEGSGEPGSYRWMKGYGTHGSIT
jgi:hypothetical protein